ncbi:2-(S)-hydroxypropyl-CoM dehydrogenase [Nonomuraea coxensis DSM 45129]|uniref:2-(S)-hydroxypropyl-CoM dehydrogenase n=1 Tax=Nonomuraea coxensis DSM 45129 TaxID=1122611 RepID=A0ABX8TXM0_9ACTN|nr:SDR family oxidoreductase [Nonomuraea coxensis]QYC40202.1 2-(S)-hydroxypropyl-CoM dehydrogenase [Nonomuraea coxensis DSM 45129]
MGDGLLGGRCVVVTGAGRELGRAYALACAAHGAAVVVNEARLRRITEVNVLGVQFAAVHAMRAMVRRGAGGSIVTIVSGARSGIPGMSAYGATKGAVAAMTAGWARDCASAGIRVNAVSPLAETGMAALDTRPDRPALGAPGDVAPVVVALLSDATRGVTGRIVRFDGAELGVYAPETLTPVPRRAAGDPAASIAEALTRLGDPAAA